MTQKRLFDIDWSDTSQCQACKKDEGTENAQAMPLPRMTRSQTRDARSFQEVGANNRTSKEEWKWQRGIVEHPLCGSQRNRDHFSMRKWESESTRAGACQQKGHVCHGRLFVGERWQAVSMWFGQWYRWTTMKRWDHCMACMLNGGRIRGSAQGGVDSLLVPSQKSVWTHQGPRGQQGNN